MDALDPNGDDNSPGGDDDDVSSARESEDVAVAMEEEVEVLNDMDEGWPFGRAVAKPKLVGAPMIIFAAV